MSKAEALRHMEMAREALEVAQHLLADGYTRHAASRAYYGMFHAGHALLTKHDLSTKTHRGLLSVLRDRFLGGPLLEEDLADLVRAQRLREAGDYDLVFPIEAEDIVELLEAATRFVDRVDAAIG